MTPAQAAAFKELAEARGGFAPLPERMFGIRGSDGWNVAQQLLVTETAPRADRLLDIWRCRRRIAATSSGSWPRRS